MLRHRVGGVDRADQAEVGGVVEGDGMIEVADDLNRDERAEYFSVEQGVIVGEVVEQNRGDPAAGLRLIERGDGVGEREEALLRGAVDHRADLGGGVARLAEAQRFDRGDEAIRESGGDVGEDDHPADRGATLTGETEDGGGEIGGGGIEVGAGIDDRGVATAEFGLDRERSGSGGGDDRSADRD